MVAPSDTDQDSPLQAQRRAHESPQGRRGLASASCARERSCRRAVARTRGLDPSDLCPRLMRAASRASVVLFGAERPSRCREARAVGTSARRAGKQSPHERSPQRRPAVCTARLPCKACRMAQLGGGACVPRAWPSTVLPSSRFTRASARRVRACVRPSGARARGRRRRGLRSSARALHGQFCAAEVSELKSRG